MHFLVLSKVEIYFKTIFGKLIVGLTLIFIEENLIKTLEPFYSTRAK